MIKIILLTRVLASFSLSPIEGVSDEWVRSPHLTTELICGIHSSEENLVLGSHVSFVEHNDEEKWRIVSVYSDQITLLEEGSSPVTTSVSPSIDYFVCSPSGRYVLIVSEPDVQGSSTYDIRVLDTETSELHSVNATDISGIPYGSLVWDNGNVLLPSYDQSIDGIQVSSLSLKFYSLPDYTNPKEHQIQYQFMQRCFSENYLLISLPPSGLFCFNTDGTEMWHLPEVYAQGPPAISNCEMFFLLPLQSNSNLHDLNMRAIADGNSVESYSLPFSRISFDRPVFSQNSPTWTITAHSPELARLCPGSFDDFIITITDRHQSFETNILPLDNLYHRLEVIGASSDYLLAYLRGSGEGRYLLLDRSFNLLFASSQGPSPGGRASLQQGSSYNSSCIISSGEKVLYSDSDGISLLTIGDAQ